MARECKTFPFKLKNSDDGQGIIEGYLSVFNVVDQGKDRVIKGAFKRTIANSKKKAADKLAAKANPVADVVAEEVVSEAIEEAAAAEVVEEAITEASAE